MFHRKLKPGDRVRLKSGGPEMTVDQIFENPGGPDQVTVVWFVKAVAKNTTVSTDTLELVTGAQPS